MLKVNECRMTRKNEWKDVVTKVTTKLDSSIWDSHCSMCSLVDEFSFGTVHMVVWKKLVLGVFL